MEQEIQSIYLTGSLLCLHIETGAVMYGLRV